MSEGKDKKIRRYAHDPSSEVTLVVYPVEWLHVGRAFDVFDQNGEFLGRIFGQQGRKETFGGKRYVWKTPPLKEFWYTKTPEATTKSRRQFESQADAIRSLLFEHEKQAQS